MRNLLVLMILVGSASRAYGQLPPAASQQVDYDRDVRPILSQNCYSCHGPAVQQSGLRLDLRQNALRGGDYGPVIVAGDSANGRLIRRLVGGDGGMQMPPTGSLTDEEIGLLRASIDQGPEFRTEIVETPPRPVEPAIAAAITDVRWGTAASVGQRLAANPDLMKAKDLGGSTVLALSPASQAANPATTRASK